MNEAINEQYFLTLAHQIRRGQDSKFLNGMVPGGWCYGYTNVLVVDPTGKTRHGRPVVLGMVQVVLEDEAQVVRRIFEFRSEGLSSGKIALLLNAEGIPAPAARFNSDATWKPGTIRSVLRNVIYRGVRVRNRTRKARDPETGRVRVVQRPEQEWLTLRVPSLQIVSHHQFDKAHGKWSEEVQ